MKEEYLAQRNIEEMVAAFLHSEPIRYRENGNRKVSARLFMSRIQKLAPRLGITRIADISHLSPINFPVFQSTRPAVFYHTKMGQNSGSQGKGLSKSQAIVSCLMETLESYCMEPRTPVLYRNSYTFLSQSQFAIDPKTFTPAIGKKAASPKEALMWTEVYSWRHKRKVLVPAELVYFPLNTVKYDTRAIFATGTNGLAAGSTYLEAAIHGMYELIERHYTEFFFLGKTEVIKIDAESFKLLNQSQKKILHSKEYELGVFLMHLPSVEKNLPVISAILRNKNKIYMGWGCNASLEISFQRALSECFQSLATSLSGSREDMDMHHEGAMPTAINEHILLQFRCPSLDQEAVESKILSKKFLTRDFTNLKDEFTFLLRWLLNLGCHDIYFANLTRNGLDIPVVKTLVPALYFPSKKRFPRAKSSPENFQFFGVS